jgi:hypothetical protein
MQLENLIVRTKERILELESIIERLKLTNKKSILHLTTHSLGINKFLLTRLFDIYTQSCRINGKEVGRSNGVAGG